MEAIATAIMLWPEEEAVDLTAHVVLSHPNGSFFCSWPLVLYIAVTLERKALLPVSG